jgi:hypothetical protein
MGISVDKSSSHLLSHSEIGGDNPCYQHLSGPLLVESPRPRNGDFRILLHQSLWRPPKNRLPHNGQIPLLQQNAYAVIREKARFFCILYTSMKITVTADEPNPIEVYCGMRKPNTHRHVPSNCNDSSLLLRMWELARDIYFRLQLASVTGPTVTPRVTPRLLFTTAGGISGYPRLQSEQGIMPYPRSNRE